MLSKEAFILVRNLIAKHTQIEFKKKKEEMMEKRLVHFKESDWQNYARMIATASQAYQALMVQRTK